MATKWIYIDFVVFFQTTHKPLVKTCLWENYDINWSIVEYIYSKRITFIYLYPNIIILY